MMRMRMRMRLNGSWRMVWKESVLAMLSQIQIQVHVTRTWRNSAAKNKPAREKKSVFGVILEGLDLWHIYYCPYYPILSLCALHAKIHCTSYQHDCRLASQARPGTHDYNKRRCQRSRRWRTRKVRCKCWMSFRMCEVCKNDQEGKCVIPWSADLQGVLWPSVKRQYSIGESIHQLYSCFVWWLTFSTTLECGRACQVQTCEPKQMSGCWCMLSLDFPILP